MTAVHHIQAPVRGRRQELGVSQELLARSAGTSRKWLSKFERVWGNIVGVWVICLKRRFRGNVWVAVPAAFGRASESAEIGVARLLRSRT